MDKKTSFRIFGLAMVMALVPTMTKAQFSINLADYTYSTGVNASKWYTLTNTAQLCTDDAGDYGCTPVQNIGFAFPFAGVDYTQWSASGDGVLQLGGSQVDPGAWNSGVFDLTPEYGPYPRVIAFGHDGSCGGGSSYIHAQVFGDTVLVVESYIGNAYSGDPADAMYQIQLFRDGTIQIVYSPTVGNNYDGYSLGVVDASGNCWVVNDASVASYHAGGSTAKRSSWPEQGRYYRWKYPSSCPYPTGLTVSNVTATGYTASWTAATGVQGYVLYNNLTPHPTTGTTYTVSGLGGCEGDYTVSVASVCGTNVGDTSRPMTTIVNLGGSTSFHEDFDSYTGSGVSTGCGWEQISAGYAMRTIPTGWWFPGAYNGNSPSDGTNNIWLSQSTCSGPGLLPGSTTHMEFKHATPGLKTYAALPLLGIPASSVSLDFKYMIENSCVTMYLGIMTDLSNESNAIASYRRLMTLNTTGEWTPVHADLATLIGTDYAGNTYRVVFEYANSCSGLGYRGYIDEVNIGQDPCSAPTNVSFTDVTATSLQLGWSTANAPATATYTILLNGRAIDTTAAGASSYTITGLAPLSRYTVGVRTNCIDCEQDSKVISLSARTLCSGTVTAPYSENFDAYSTGISTSTAAPTSYPNHTVPSCWTYTGLSNNMNSYPQVFITSANAHLENCLMFINSASSQTSYAVLPQVSNADVSHLRLDFWHRESATSTSAGELTIGTMVNPNDASTFVPLRTLSRTTTWTRVQDTLGLHDPATTAQYIAIRYSGGTGNSQWAAIDSVNVTVVDCLPVSHFEASNITSNSIHLSWSDHNRGTATYTITCNGNTYTTAAGATQYDLTGLPPITYYTISIAANCSPSTHSDTITIKTRTACAGTITVPYGENFDYYSAGSSASGAAPGEYPNHAVPSCWTLTGISNSTTTYPQIFITSADAHEGRGLRFINGAASNVSYAVMPEVSNADVAHIRLDFWYRQSAAATTCGELTIGTMTNASDASTFVPLRPLPQVTGWTRVQDTLGLHDPAPTARYIAFRYSGGTANAQWSMIDSVRLTLINCLPVSNLSATNITSTGYRVTWDEHNGAPITYTVNCNGMNFTTAPGANYYDISGLPKASFTLVTVTPSCGGDARSRYISTSCSDGVDLPYTENFDVYPGISTNTNPPASYPNHSLPNCWQFLNLSNGASLYPQAFLTNNGTYRVSGNGMVMRNFGFKPLFAILPLPTGTTPTARLRLSFQYKQSVATDAIGELTYGVMSNPNSARSFVALGTLNKTTAWTSVQADLGTYDSYKAAFSNTDRPYVAIKYTAGTSASTYTAIDNVRLEEICCGGLHAENLTSTGCTLKWNDFSGGTATYTIYAFGFAIGTTAAGAESYPITGLTPGSDFTFRVSPNSIGCSEMTVTVHTPCTGGSLPYTENFDGFATSDGVSTGTNAPTTSGRHYNDNANAMPACWYLINRGANTSSYPQMFLTSSSSYRVSTNNGFLFKGRSTEGPAYAVVATNFGVPAEQMIISFKYKVSNANSMVEYGMMPNPGDPQSFISLGYTRSTNWVTVTDTLINHPELPSGILYLAFRYSCSNTTTYYGAIDDVSITTLPPCGLYDLKVRTLNATSARISWRDPYGDDKVYTIKESGNVIGTTDTGERSFVVTGLSTNTQYNFTVESSCGATQTIPFIIIGYGCIDPTDLTANYTTGYYGAFSNPYQTVGIVNNGPSANNSRHTIHTNTNEVDSRTQNQLHTIPAGHTKSVRLGNWSTGKQAEALVYTMTVDTLISDMLVMKYACVMQAAGHTAQEQPRFTLEILDDAQQAIDPTCGEVDFIASTDLGWHQIGTGSNAVLWKDWSSISLDLKAYHGQTIFIRLTTYDCSQSGHYGYAYFTLECRRRAIEATTCGAQQANTFTAPDGFGYQWYTDTTQAPISTAREISASANESRTYYCRLSFYDLPGCEFMMSAYAGVRLPLPLFDTLVTWSNCQFDINFINKSTITSDGVNPIGTGEGVESAEWRFPGSTGSPTSNQYHASAHYNRPGTYEVTLIAKLAGGMCTDTLTKQLNIVPAVHPEISGPAPHCPNSVDDTLIVSNASSTSWGSDTLIVNPQTTTTYNVTVFDRNGCEYELSYTIVIYGSNPVDTTAVVCDSIKWRGTTYTSSGNYAYVRTSGEGCSETDSLHLTVNRSNVGDTTANILNSFTWFGNTYTHSGNYTHTLHNAAGCDSVVTLHLAISTESFDTIVDCDSVLWKGITYNTSGNYQFDTLNAEGADSTLHLNLTIKNSTTSTIFDTIVENQLPHTFINDTYSNDTSHAYIHIANAVGCDSLIDYNLYVYHNIYDTVDSAVCDNWLPLVWNGETFNAAGTATTTLTAQHGEDSILTMIVSVNPTYTGDDYDTVVENRLPYVWHGLNFTASDDQTTTLSSINGCDSTVTMHLHVWPNLTGVDDSTVCDNLLPVLWNGVIFSDGGIRTATLTAQHGEDSVVTMTLHVNPTYASTEEHEICDNESYTFNGTTYNTSNTYRHVLHSREGCDSVASLRLTVHRTYRTVEDVDICANQSYEWGTPLRNVWTPVHTTMPGASQTRTLTQTDNLQSVNQCDSSSTLNLTVHGVYQTNEVDTFCFGERYRWHQWEGMLNSEANNIEKSIDLYDSLTTRRYRCDSVFYMKLTQRARPVVSMAYETGCTYKVRLSVNVPYHIITATPDDPNLEGNEQSTYFETSVAEPTEYTIYADYRETPTCPYTTTLRLDPIVPLKALLKVTPEVLTSDNLEYNLYDAGDALHTRRWLIDGVEQEDTSWHLLRLADYAADSIEVELRVFLEGCSDTASQVVYIRHNAIYVPNAFTPGRNDNNHFAIRGGDIVSGELRIYNREGLLMFQTDDYTTGWDGNNAPQGVYVWRFSYTTVGRPNTTIVETGTVLLIR